MDTPTDDTRGYLSDLCDIFDLYNFIRVKTCTMSQNGSSLDVILTNKRASFQKTCAIETGLSDFHKLVCTFFKCNFQRIPHKNVLYRTYNKFNPENFLKYVRNLPFDNLDRFSNPLVGLTTLFKSVIDRHAPLKTKMIRGNQVPYMTKELSKSIMQRSRLRNKYNKWKSRENYVALQQAKKHCKFLSKKARKEYFQKATENGIMTNKAFWKLAKPMLTNKSGAQGTAITLKEEGEFISDEKELVNIFNIHYTNIVENSTGTPPKAVESNTDQKHDQSAVTKIIDHYKNHPSIIKIKEKQLPNQETFSIPFARKEEINNLIRKIDITKSAGPDFIPPKLVKISVDVIGEHLTNVINDSISKNAFPDEAKLAHVVPIYKKKLRTDKVNYRPVSVLTTFSKIFEKIYTRINISTL